MFKGSDYTPALFDDDRWAGVSDAARELVQGLLQNKAVQRLSAQAALSLCQKWEQQQRGAATVPMDMPAAKVKGLMSRFVTFHRSQLMRQAALTAISVQLVDK